MVSRAKYTRKYWSAMRDSGKSRMETAKTMRKFMFGRAVKMTPEEFEKSGMKIAVKIPRSD